jgi:hypothetical protein
MRDLFPENARREMGCSPCYGKTLKLINNINRGEIVKNFTNFACGVAAGPIKFWRSSNRDVSAAGSRECLVEFTVFCHEENN